MIANDNQYDIFISYSAMDRSQAEIIAGLLSETGLKVWFDLWNLVPGKSWKETAIENPER